MSNPTNLNVVGCPLSLVNGDYVATEDNDSFLHSSGKYSLKHTPSGHWEIRESRTGVQVGNSLTPSKSPIRLKWEYLSVKDRAIKHTASMQCLTSGEIAAVDIPGEYDEEDPSLLDPVLLTSSFDALVETFRPVPHLPPLAGDDPNICSVQIHISANKSTEVFLPLSGTAELGLEPLSLARLTTLEEAAPYWTSTVASYEHKIQNAAEEAEAREKELRSTIERLKSGAQDSNLRERLFRQTSNSWAHQGKGFHVKRDVQHNHQVAQSLFPQGEGVRDEFGASFLQFETFAADAVTCLEERMGHAADGAAVLVRDVMVPIFEATERFVTDKLNARRALLQEEFGVTLEEGGTEDSAARLFWYFSQQPQLLRDVAALTEGDIAALVAGAGTGTVVRALQQHMRAAAESGELCAEEDSLCLFGIARHLLRLHALTKLSDPRCYLHPAPGQRVAYREGHCAEVLSPGTIKHGRIMEGDMVEVVLCGLYFENPDSSHKPTFPCLVRRLA